MTPIDESFARAFADESIAARNRRDLAVRTQSSPAGMATPVAPPRGTPGAGATPRVRDAAWASQMATGAGSAESYWHVQPTVRSFRIAPP